MRLTILLVAVAMAGGCAHTSAALPVRENFEDGAIDAAFEPCARPENAIRVTDDPLSLKGRSLMLKINVHPLFPAEGERPAPRELLPTSCLIEGEYHDYWNDDAERAELWENRATSPTFGDETFYGFSMLMTAGSAPAGDYNRLVVGQWKARGDDSPFLAQRFTNGFYHITLDVDAMAIAGPKREPTTCKVLLAFTNQPPSIYEPPLDRNRRPQCETRLEFIGNRVIIKDPPRIERHAYLPTPDGTAWIDLVFQVKGGKDGVVRVWANGDLIAEAIGTIGHEAGIGQTQYFKFGPYRDVAGNEAVFYLDNLARGKSYDEVDPSGP